jgi:hypothetical protein
MINDMQLSTDVAAVNSMDDTELQGIVAGELEDAVSYIDADISPIRAKGTEYYRGDPFGNEEDGRSQVVAMEVRDTVSAMLPSLMKVFFSSENVVEYVPRGPEDVASTQQATDYANYIFSNDNNGFMTTMRCSKTRWCVSAASPNTGGMRLKRSRLMTIRDLMTRLYKS